MTSNLNYYYNFKNTIRFFVNIDNLSFPEEIDNIKKLSWCVPVNFRIKKDDNSYRIIKLPNILNFYCAFNIFKNYDNFNLSKQINNHTKLVPNIITGDFMSGEYDKQVNRELQLLCIYDNLLKVDIKSFYDSIYTHNLDFLNHPYHELFITNYNSGNTNGLIMGNYISLYIAEKFLSKIAADLDEKLKNFNCRFYYFSDDFYFFCNSIDNTKILDIFDKVLEKYDLERNPNKLKTFSYLEYNDEHILNRYWASIISGSKQRFNKHKINNTLYFLNQLVYRLPKLKNYNLQKIFLTTFFKSKYFSNLNLKDFCFREYNQHQFCYIISICPEILLYSIDKLKDIDFFKGETFKNFLKNNYLKSLSRSFNDEQLYYYYAIKVLNFNDILNDSEGIVSSSNNQILISYYLKDKIFSENSIDYLKTKMDEYYWFQNYHLILYDEELYSDLEESIIKYLLPNDIKKEKHINSYKTNIKINNKTNNKTKTPSKEAIKIKYYIDFYSENLKSRKSFINDSSNIKSSIEKYIKNKNLDF